MDKVRIDRWLWSVRIFKSRSLATKTCKSSKVSINDKSVKPSFLLQRGDIIHVHKNGFIFTFKAVDLINKRVSATLAAPCYEDLTPESELNKYKSWYVGKARPEFRDKGAGRPTKRDRRDLETFKSEFYFDDE